MCKGCQLEKDEACFYRDKSRPLGLSVKCKTCKNIQISAYTKSHQAATNEYQARYRAQHKEKTCLYNARYQKTHKEELRHQKHDRYLDNRDREVARSRAWKENNRAYHNAWNKERYQREKDNIAPKAKLYRQKNRAKKIQYTKDRKKNDPVFAISLLCRGRVGAMLRRNRVKKSEKTFDLIGCSPDFLAKHLESQFTEGMSWATQGKFGWVIDHIVPLAAFNLADPEQQKLAFHWSNQQPLWWRPNIIKKDRICTEEELKAYRDYRPAEGEIKV